jgi:hypothetical protein
MPKLNGLLPVAILLVSSLSAMAQEAPDATNPHVDENPFRNEQPKAVPAQGVVQAVKNDGRQWIAVQKAVVVEARPATTEVRFADDDRSIMIELPVQQAPEVQAEFEDAPPPPPPVARGMNLKNAVVTRENFDRWVFGVTSEKARLHKLDRILFWTVENVAWQNTMTEQERAKLTLAGKGDIKRLLDRIEAERQDFEEARMNLTTGRQALQRLKPLSVEVEKGPFGDDSLFAKVARKIESDRKKAREVSP